MRISIIGASGNVGSRIVEEALRRQHKVTGVARDPSGIRDRPNLVPAAADANHPDKLARVLAGHDVVVSSVPFLGVDLQQLVHAVRLSGVPRYCVVGGAGSLEVAPGQLNVDQPGFPAFARAEATRGKEALEYLRAVEDLDWTFLSPSSLLTAGERTGKFRLGGDQLLTGADGRSWISYEDYAVALLDEIETPRHARRRFTVGY